MVKLHVHGHNYGRYPQGAVLELDSETAQKELRLCPFALEPEDCDDFTDVEGRPIPSRKTKAAQAKVQEQVKQNEQWEALQRIRAENDREVEAAQSARAAGQRATMERTMGGVPGEARVQIDTSALNEVVAKMRGEIETAKVEAKQQAEEYVKQELGPAMEEIAKLRQALQVSEENTSKEREAAKKLAQENAGLKAEVEAAKKPAEPARHARPTGR